MTNWRRWRRLARYCANTSSIWFRRPDRRSVSCFGELSNVLGTLTVPFVLRLTWSANGLLFWVLDDVF